MILYVSLEETTYYILVNSVYFNLFHAKSSPKPHILAIFYAGILLFGKTNINFIVC